ncbi:MULTISPECIES: beta-ketoacyl-ACP synthase III FabHB [Bacillus amyloliquefaciens group]|uniref:beta-ketoacyl-ACP synthase III FabHB n=1 Tax=Bacillus amyloliquefaciens group TaxID=1938374 RepID=UPI000B51B6F0|nr:MULTISPECIES: beta-ketoacyl-ACP synthase III FabHB [Bacillus amyloliquefaciens group]ASF28263.1 3-oxoacyl-ACP synthase [Bacillus amyloliquefaciens]MDQ8094488.1 beta-ketoacyl-ACP synthase III FabHB [Bacillus amyloliquefaciens]
MSKSKITAIGTYAPARRLTNADLERIVDTSDEWIVQRTGMKERRIAGEHEFTSDLCIEAVKNLAERYSGTLDDVDMILVATTTADYAFPSTAARVQAYFGWPHTGVLDINATCAGLTYGLQLADALITAGTHEKVIVIAGETLSKVTDYTDRSTCVLFGDAAGALLVERDEAAPGFLAAVQGTVGSGADVLYRTGLSAELNGQPLKGGGNMVQNGREVYKWAVRTVPEEFNVLLEKAGFSKDDLDWFVPHSANMRMIESICEKLPFPAERTLTSVEYYGNTSSVSIILALDEAVKAKKLSEGQTLVLFGFGGGLTYTGLLVRWGF